MGELGEVRERKKENYSDKTNAWLHTKKCFLKNVKIRNRKKKEKARKRKEKKSATDGK